MNQPLPGDFNADGILDASDLDVYDLLPTNPRRSFPVWPISPRELDLNGDLRPDQNDRDFWIREIRGTWYGDANLDGEFNELDLVQVMNAGEYLDDIAWNSTWSTGDWDGDGDFTVEDFVAAFTDGGYNLGPRNQVVAVPEPATLILSGVGILLLCSRRMRTTGLISIK